MRSFFTFIAVGLAIGVLLGIFLGLLNYHNKPEHDGFQRTVIVALPIFASTILAAGAWLLTMVVRLITAIVNKVEGHSL
ncbi:MAG: hypothetical protein EHM67_02385 [Hyphomicrobiaceae bacterium]|nr:MAG: hypothetical protein EHM67_02385 [Hyphomicrobiaceae bacterium]